MHASYLIYSCIYASNQVQRLPGIQWHSTIACLATESMQVNIHLIFASSFLVASLIILDSDVSYFNHAAVAWKERCYLKQVNSDNKTEVWTQDLGFLLNYELNFDQSEVLTYEQLHIPHIRPLTPHPHKK